MRDPYDLDDIENHHPPCRGPCGQLADECMCWTLRPRRKTMSEQDPSQVVTETGDDFWVDGSDPTGNEHLCHKGALGVEVAPGPVEECCADLWRDDGVEP